MDINNQKAILKKYKEHKAELEYEAEKIHKEMSRLSKEIFDVTNKIFVLEDSIKNHLGNDVEVTDHAIVSYFNVCLGYDIEEIKGKILNDKIKGLYKTLGKGIFENGDFKIHIRDNKVLHVKK